MPRPSQVSKARPGAPGKMQIFRATYHPTNEDLFVGGRLPHRAGARRGPKPAALRMAHLTAVLSHPCDKGLAWMGHPGWLIDYTFEIWSEADRLAP